MELPNVNYLHAAALLDTLAVCGTRRVVVSPGSRSTPLAGIAAQLSVVQTYVLYDERSAGFFALGLAKADHVPAILISTSGTATANYYPAVIEAAQSCVPLILITADRPVRMRYSGAPQTIDQIRLYAEYPRWFVDIPEPRLDFAHVRAVGEIAQRAFAASMSQPAGPVHINVPLDEPLSPIEEEANTASSLWETLRVESSVPSLQKLGKSIADEMMVELAKAVESAWCGLIVAGPYAARNEEDGAALFRLGKRLGWPILADIGSGVRFFSAPVVPFYDVFLRCESLARLEPDVVLAFGAHPISRTLNNYLDRHRAARTFRIQPHGLPQDPSRRATRTILGEPTALEREVASRIASARDSLLLDPFLRASQHIAVRLDEEPHPAPYRNEALLVRDSIHALPDGAALVLANSLPIRYADTLAAASGARIQTHVMRGANGIDGTLSLGAGVAAASSNSTLLVTGDLAFLHDLNGLYAAARHAHRMTILLLNNNGGGIFHHLPVHTDEHPELFERIHGTPHSLHLKAAGELFGIGWRRICEFRELESALRAEIEGVQVIEAAFDRESSATEFRGLIDRLCASLDA